MKMKHQLRFTDKGITIEVESGKNLLEAMISAGLHVDAPCGGHGTCGKCTVNIRAAAQADWETVKACRTQVETDLEVRLPDENDSLNVLLDAGGKGLEARKPWNGSEALAERIPNSAGMYMAAFDLGTTSVAGYLINARGETVVKKGAVNPQVSFGADVISRINYAMENGTEPLAACAREVINELVTEMCREQQLAPEAICAVSVVGNTAMHHLFLNIAPDCLGRAPYMPAVREAQLLRAADCGIRVHPEADLLMLPVIAGYVGADTVGCLVSGDWHEREMLTLLVDIGTNGELVLGDKNRRIACSTAAGPALEGAKIQCGMRGVEGAVDRVWLEGEDVRWHAIGDGEARGICGSGLVDLVAVLLRKGVIDETGRFEEGNSFALEGSSVVLTQKDVREVQLAKGAICAGIRLMAKKLGVALRDIEEVHIAGAFGNYLDTGSACDIGLIPEELREKVIKVGNAAGEGAGRVLKNRDYWETAQRLAAETEFLELASLAEFQDVFVDELEFPE